ncbi:MAG: nitronate monooxygenase [Holophaga sp.]|nr:nitronate monooxygenase [Holophaga sp.]
MDLFARLSQTKSEPWLLQGWFPGQSLELAGAFAQGGGLGVLRVPAFPGEGELEAWIEKAKGAGLDLKGLRDRFREVVEQAKQRSVPFLAHGPEPSQRLLEYLRGCGIPRLAFVQDPEEAERTAQEGADALVVQAGNDLAERLAEIHRRTGLPLLAEAEKDLARAKELLQIEGVKGLQLRSPLLLHAAASVELPGFSKLASIPSAVLGEGVKALPRLKIRNLDLPYPIIQGGMGVGVSWEGLAGAVARTGCVGIVSAIGTGNHFPDMVELRQGRPLGPENLNNSEALTRIVKEAIRRSEGKGAVGVNILCAIQGYERVVRASVDAGAQLIISGAGLPLNLPGYVGDADVALLPIVSSARALGLICKTWQRKFNRLPDAVVLEGPESGGHQGFSAEQIADPAFSLEALLGPVIEERNKWGDFPVIVAGGVWDRADIDRFLALGAGGVQIATRFIGTLECDADANFKEVILKAEKKDIQLVKSPVGMPGRAVVAGLQASMLDGTAPKIRCISDCVSPCEHGVGAREVGYCIADRLEDARSGKKATGLFFTGSNGWKLKELVSVRELVAELTQDF